MGTIQKVDAGYVFYDEGHTDYSCGECGMFLESQRRCEIHRLQDGISPHGSCNYMVYGSPKKSGQAHGQFTKQTSGYVENIQGFSCKRCKYWDRSWDCEKVDRNSPGFTPKKIHPNACCSLWERHPIRGGMKDSALAEVTRGL